jgi:hypothetical protein
VTIESAGEPAAAPAAPPPSFFRRNRVKIVLLGILLSGIGGVWLWIFATLKFSFSTGDRVGYVQKLSRRGWVCRTWEGELAMSPVPGAVPTIFEGKKVSLHYEEKKGIPSSCFGDTHYFITDVRVLQQ